MNERQYETFVTEVSRAEKVELHSFEDIRPFEGCLPIEVMVERGKDTLRYGPMKPVGLEHPETGERSHAVVQLRQENAAASLYNLVGFQTKMSWGFQKKVFRMIPGLENAEFVRLGSIHRNTFINSPMVLTPRLNLKKHPRIFMAMKIRGCFFRFSLGVSTMGLLMNVLRWMEPKRTNSAFSNPGIILKTFFWKPQLILV